MEDASSFQYFLLSAPSNIANETQASGLSITCREATSTSSQSVNTVATVSADANDLALTTATANNLMKDAGDTVSLTAVPVVFTSEGHLTHILKVQPLTESDPPIDVNHGGEGICTTSTTQSEDFPALFRATDRCALEMLSTVTDGKSRIALLQPAHGITVTTSDSAILHSERKNELNSDMLATQETSSNPESSKSTTLSSVEIQDLSRTEADLPVGLSKSSLTLNIPSQTKGKEIYMSVESVETDKVLCDVSGLGPNDRQISIPVVLKTNGESAALPMVLSNTGDSLEIESSAVDKSEDSPSSIFPEGAVLVETPQGLMLSVGDELRAVTLTEGPDAQGNQLLSISNNCIPVALLSQCTQEGLIEGQGTQMVFEGSQEGDTENEGPVVCSAELPLVTQQVLTVSTAEDDEPKKKNRGWPKGKKRKTTPVVHSPRAPMTGRRQEIKQSHPNLPFTEVTKVLGQEWSAMPLDKKQKYLDEAENDKQRYIDELKQFQKSEVYQTLVKKKKDKGDEDTEIICEIEDDTDELHCKVCKLYFSSLHNKKEHLLGKQHLQTITDHLKKELKKQQKEQEDPLVAIDLEDTSVTFSSELREVHEGQCSCQANKPVDISSFIIDFVHKNSEREQEISALRCILRKYLQENWNICKQIEELKDYENKLRQDLRNLSENSADLSDHIRSLKMVPALFGVVDF